MTQARFQHLDYQTEGVQEQLAELYYKHKWPFSKSFNLYVMLNNLF